MRLGKTLCGIHELAVRGYDYYHIRLPHCMQVLVRDLAHNLYRGEFPFYVDSDHIAIPACRTHDRVDSPLKGSAKFLY